MSLACENILQSVLILHNILVVTELSSGDVELYHKFFVVMGPSYDGSQDPPLHKPLLFLFVFFAFDSLDDKRV